MKNSIYNYLIDDRKFGLILYNTLSDKMINLNEQMFDFLRRTNMDPVLLNRNNAALYDAMLTHKFIIDDEVDEFDDLVKQIHDEDNLFKSVHITINPTLDCNFKCWYCYESLVKHSIMSESMVESVKKYIRNKARENSTKKIVLSFFGGEPLMYYFEIMRPIILFSEQVCEEYNVILDIHITTNGYLLTNEIVDDLTNYSFVSLQIPFDGGRMLHNKVKCNKDDLDVFETTINYVKYAVENRLETVVRCNYTLHNIDSFHELITRFKDFDHYQGRLTFAFHKIWQEKQSSELTKKHTDIIQKLISRGYDQHDETLKPQTLCYADYKSNLTINYNGDIYKCTARDFSSSNAIGMLNCDGVPQWNNNYQKRENCKYKSEKCIICKIFPICLQGCSQIVYEFNNDKKCVYSYSTDDIHNIVMKRVASLLTLINSK